MNENKDVAFGIWKGREDMLAQEPHSQFGSSELQAMIVAEASHMQSWNYYVLRELLTSLPTKRDWLSPDVEAALRVMLANTMVQKG